MLNSYKAPCKLDTPSLPPTLHAHTHIHTALWSADLIPYHSPWCSLSSGHAVRAPLHSAFPHTLLFLRQARYAADKAPCIYWTLCCKWSPHVDIGLACSLISHFLLRCHLLLSLLWPPYLKWYSIPISPHHFIFLHSIYHISLIYYVWRLSPFPH